MSGLILPERFLKPEAPQVEEAPILDSAITDAVKELPVSGEGKEVLIYALVPPSSEMLYKPTKEFDFDDPPISPEEFALNMVATMQHHNGLGLSANQVGFPWRVFAMKAAVPFVCFNPKLVDISEETIKLEEGCLSFPGLVAEINRPRHIKVRFQVPSGIFVTKTFTGLTARIFQHELEHLDGETFIDGIGRMRMEKALKEAGKMGYNYRQYNLLKRAVA